MEDVQHVFFRCDVAQVVLRKICRWWDLDWQEICSFSDWDAWFLSFRLSSRLKSILEGVFMLLGGGFGGFEISLGHKTKKEWVKELNYKHRINFLALQETKMDCISHMDVKSLWGNSNFGFVASDSLGNSGGILCIWEASIFKKDGAGCLEDMERIISSQGDGDVLK
ncbi:hypothetical protein Tco_1364741 [Tanacetum coccineum]